MPPKNRFLSKKSRLAMLLTTVSSSGESVAHATRSEKALIYGTLRAALLKAWE